MSKALTTATELVNRYAEVKRLQEELEAVNKAIAIVPDYTSSARLTIGVPLVSVTGRNTAIMETPAVWIDMDQAEVKALMLRQKESLEELLINARARAEQALNDFSGKTHEQA